MILGRLVLGIVLVIPFHSWGQEVNISGRVVDSESLKPIPAAHIFIVKTSSGTVSNADGGFNLMSDNYGETDLIVTAVGYETLKKHVIFSSPSISLATIGLKLGVQPTEVVLVRSRDSQWGKDIKKFKTIFFGNDEFAGDCLIQNPWVIDLKNDATTHSLQGRSVEPIVVINKALGYEVSFNLENFTSGPNGNKIEGDAWFTLLQPSTQKEIDRWQRNRETAHGRSLLGDSENIYLPSMLPLNYVPKGDESRIKRKQVTEALPWLYEKIYIHTDKPYYYGGEQMWFKGYINYQTPTYRDSLSRTVYVDVISPDKKILLTKTLRSDSGRFSGQFEIPSASDAGTYNLRAYTNLQRNFGDSTLYVKPFPIFELTDMVEGETPKQILSTELTINTTKETFKNREKIEVKINLRDANGNPLHGDLSVSVTDAKQVSPIHTAPDITKEYPIGQVPVVVPAALLDPFVVEYGISLHGRFFNDINRPQKALLNVVQLNPNDLVLTESDDDGYFTANHFTIYDSARFSITASDKKGNSRGHAILLENNKPSIILQKLMDSVKITTTTLTQRALYDYSKPGEVRMLDPVIIRGKRIQEEYTPEFRIKRPYGKANYALSAKDFKGAYPNLLMALPGRFPGLIVRQALNPGEAPRWVVYLHRNATASVNYVSEVVVTVNSALMGGTPESILSSIDMSMVEAVELKTGMNVIYGSASFRGVLSVYLKDGMSAGTERPKVGTVVATGYSASPAFSSPDYEKEKSELPDYRSTIYWSPVVFTGSDGTATVSFYAADIDTIYRIEVEGINSEGKAVRAVKTIQIISN